MTTFAGDNSVGYPLEPAVKQTALQPDSSNIGKAPWHQLRRLMALRRFLKSNQPDLVVSFLTNVNVAALMASLGLGVRVIVCERIFPPLFSLSRVLNLLRRLTYPLAYRVVVQTQASQRWFAEALPRAHTTIIANPLVLPITETAPALPIDQLVDAQSRLVLSVGRLDEQKGFVDLIEAFATLGDVAKQWQLVVLGEGPQRRILADKIAELGLEDCVQLPGWAGNIAQWYRRADLFVLSSHFEGFPNALLEAMGHSLPCIAYDCPTGPADLIGDGCSGYLVPLASGSLGLADRMEKLMDNERLRQSFATQARSEVDRFADHRIFQKWSELLDSAP